MIRMLQSNAVSPATCQGPGVCVVCMCLSFGPGLVAAGAVWGVSAPPAASGAWPGAGWRVRLPAIRVCGGTSKSSVASSR